MKYKITVAVGIFLGLFFVGWFIYGTTFLRGDEIMPMWYKLPLLLSFFGCAMTAILATGTRDINN